MHPVSGGSSSAAFVIIGISLALEILSFVSTTFHLRVTMIMLFCSSVLSFYLTSKAAKMAYE